MEAIVLNHYGKEIRKKFYNKLLIMAVILIPLSTAFIVFAIIYWIKYINLDSNLFFPIFFSFFGIASILVSIKTLYPYMKDLRYVRQKQWLVAEGVVVGFKKVNFSGAPPTADYYPILKNKDDELLTLEVDDMEQGKPYHVIYLPYTKLAVITGKEY